MCIESEAEGRDCERAKWIGEKESVRRRREKEWRRGRDNVKGAGSLVYPVRAQ